jgi:hypothetical protein
VSIYDDEVILTRSNIRLYKFEYKAQQRRFKKDRLRQRGTCSNGSFCGL